MHSTYINLAAEITIYYFVFEDISSDILFYASQNANT